ncbi:hypothetical protein [Idiomarina sp.]|uniref:hypothetical protein n=1 Tax=Idiomarina sp. TaxID=1874361 RepID=UPI0025C3C34A|nr:hypothetical protein [Idiomarina sp.]NQZ04533.1 hypothetical protein [Idiomarina sp.]
MSKILIVGGFHRSGTSMLTQLLTQGGCKLPTQLVGPNITNPDGHFEDFRVIKLHDHWLSQNSVSWQFSGNKRLVGNSSELESLLKRLSVNLEPNDTILVKDPRICLFLDEWEASLSENVRYIFVVRHWMYSFESLLARHSKRIAESIKSYDLGRHLNFWLEPELAANMWLSYNQALLRFRERHPHKVILLTQRSLSDRNVLNQCVQKLGFDTKHTETYQDTSKLNAKVSERLIRMVSHSLREQLNKVWGLSRLACDFQSEDESVQFYSSNSSITNEYLTSSTNKLTTVSPTKCAEDHWSNVSVSTLEAKLNELDFCLFNEKESVRLLLEKADLLQEMNRIDESKAIVQQVLDLDRNNQSGWIKLFQLTELVDGFNQAKLEYESQAARLGIKVVAIEHRIGLRNDFTNAKPLYVNSLKSLATDAERQKYLSIVLREVPDSIAKEDLKDRLCALWGQ